MQIDRYTVINLANKTELRRLFRNMKGPSSSDWVERYLKPKDQVTNNTLLPQR